MLPELSFKLDRIYQDELFFESDQELMRVLTQNNPVYLTLELPGLLTQVQVCFPAPFTTRVYAGHIHKDNMVGKVVNKYYAYKVPAQIRYRYGMRLLPWMFFVWLDPKTHRERAKRDNVVNYSVLNSAGGHNGVLIRILRKHDSSEKNQEYLEIYHFYRGNPYNFAEKWRSDPDTKMIARFVPEEKDGDSLRWRFEMS